MSIASTTLYNPFPNFSFTGPLRPIYPLSPRRPVPDHIQVPNYAKDGDPKYKFAAKTQIQILDQKGQDGMRKVCRLAREILDAAAREIKPGVTTDYLDKVVHDACIERDVSSQLPYTRQSLLMKAVLPVTIELPLFPQIPLHIPKRSYMSWDS